MFLFPNNLASTLAQNCITMTFSHFCLDWEADRHTPYTPRESGAERKRNFSTLSLAALGLLILVS